MKVLVRRSAPPAGRDMFGFCMRQQAGKGGLQKDERMKNAKRYQTLYFSELLVNEGVFITALSRAAHSGGFKIPKHLLLCVRAELSRRALRPRLM